LLHVLAIACALSADSFALSVALGLQQPHLGWRGALRIATVFALCQSGLAWAGVCVGGWVAPGIGAFDHWIVAALLGALGLRALWKAWRGEAEVERATQPSWALLCLLGLATSLDALSVGFGFGLLQGDHAAFVGACAGVTWLASLCGVRGAARLGARLGARSERLAMAGGGLVLLLLGAHTLWQHLRDGV
jgi:putative Mn2+ efflux pump MntP